MYIKVEAILKDFTPFKQWFPKTPVCSNSLIAHSAQLSSSHAVRGQ